MSVPLEKVMSKTSLSCATSCVMICCVSRFHIVQVVFTLAVPNIATLFSFQSKDVRAEELGLSLLLNADFGANVNSSYFPPFEFNCHIFKFSPEAASKSVCLPVLSGINISFVGGYRCSMSAKDTNLSSTCWRTWTWFGMRLMKLPIAIRCR
eukprot:Lithocolla_globosa_v1_NODE_2675_length_1909_cov_28.972492.p2 type:complete len:152 gc:universal NODE_2675_length_1909_cov_28.972492:976-1431(+)